MPRHVAADEPLLSPRFMTGALGDCRLSLFSCRQRRGRRHSRFPGLVATSVFANSRMPQSLAAIMGRRSCLAAAAAARLGDVAAADAHDDVDVSRGRRFLTLDAGFADASLHAFATGGSD